MARRPIREKWLSNCSGEELKQMNRLRLKGDSMMYDDVICTPTGRDKIRVFLVKEDGKRIVAWSCVLLPPKRGENCPCYIFNKLTWIKNFPIYTYVNKAYRKMGIGKRLIRRASKFILARNGWPTVFFYNEPSSKFFASLQEEIPKLEIYDIIEWWDIYDDYR